MEFTPNQALLKRHHPKIINTLANVYCDSVPEIKEWHVGNVEAQNIVLRMILWFFKEPNTPHLLRNILNSLSHLNDAKDRGVLSDDRHFVFETFRLVFNYSHVGLKFSV